MSEFVRVKLCDGKRVRDPASGHILSSERVYRFRNSQFWIRRVMAGDVAVVADEAQAPAEVVEAKPEVVAPRRKKEKLGE